MAKEEYEEPVSPIVIKELLNRLNFSVKANFNQLRTDMESQECYLQLQISVT